MSKPDRHVDRRVQAAPQRAIVGERPAYDDPQRQQLWPRRPQDEARHHALQALGNSAVGGALPGAS